MYDKIMIYLLIKDAAANPAIMAEAGLQCDDRQTTL